LLWLRGRRWKRAGGAFCYRFATTGAVRADADGKGLVGQDSSIADTDCPLWSAVTGGSSTGRVLTDARPWHRPTAYPRGARIRRRVQEVDRTGGILAERSRPVHHRNATD
jgi:hypothetical protein